MTDTWTPPLEDGETVLFHHVPSTRSFWRAMLRPAGILFLILTAPFILFRIFMPDVTSWVMIALTQFMVWAPAGLGVLLERVSLPNYETYLTNRRAISRGYGDLPLEEAKDYETLHSGVRLTEADGINQPLELRYPEDAEALVQAVDQAVKEAA